MKGSKSISFSAGLLLIAVLLSLAFVQKGTKKPFRLEEPRLAPLEESQWDDEQAKLLTPLKMKNDRILNVFSTFGRHPKLLDRFMKFGWYILLEQTLPARDREILILRIGWLCKAKYEFGQHTISGKRAGLTDEEILRITKGPDDPGWSAFESALIRAVDELYYDAIISENTWEALTEKYDEKQMMDIIFTVGEYNLVSWALNSLGVQLDEGVPGFPEGSEQ